MKNASLTQAQSRMLNAIRSARSVSVSQLSKTLGLRTPAARRTLAKLQEAGLLRQRVYLDPYKLGFTEWKVFLSLRASGPERTKFLRHLKGAEGVNIAFEVIGEYDVGFSILAKDVFEFKSRLDRALAILGDAVLSISFNLVLSVADEVFGVFDPPKHLAQSPRFECGHALGQHPVDRIDRAILAVLGEFPELSSREVARRINVPFATTQYRIRKLNEAGVVLAVQYLLSFDALPSVAYRMLISVRQDTPAVESAVRSVCASHPSVSFLLHLVGEWQYELGVLSSDAADVDSVREAIHAKLEGAIRRVTVYGHRRLVRLNGFPFAP